MAQENSGKLLVDARRMKGWTQAHLAEVAGVDVRTVQRAERGTASLETWQALAQALGVEVSKFVQPIFTETPTSTAAPAPKPPEQGGEAGGHPGARKLSRITSGKALVDIVGGAFAYEFDHDVPTGDATGPVADFLQTMQDWGDIWSDLGTGDYVRAAASVDGDLAALEKLGVWVFGGRSRRRVKMPDGESAVWPIATVIVLMRDDPRILSFDEAGNPVAGAAEAKEAP